MDFVRYPLLKLAIECGKAGGTASTAYNAANEVAVARFLNREISFLHIEEIVDKVLQQHQNVNSPDLQQIKHCDTVTREIAAKL
ncbi:1-deoxy-D-xylulose 5-phosphate reductoisomerase [compost metagenome]